MTIVNEGVETPEPVATFETITPETAEEWVTNLNAGNRKVKASSINAYARAMKAGKFPLTGETVKFDWNGNMLDGQNRCFASIKSGVPFRALVVRNLPPETRDFIDSGVMRTAKDVAGFRGLKNPRLGPPIARTALQRERGQYTHAIPNRGTPKIQNYEIMDWLEAHPDLDDFLALPRPTMPTVKGDGFVSESVWLYAAYVLWTIDPTDAIEFQKKVLERSYGAKGEPLWAFKEGLRKTRNPSASVRQEISISQALYLIFRCWNDWRDDAIVNRAYSVSYLRSKPNDEWVPRAVPEPR